MGLSLSSSVGGGKSGVSRLEERLKHVDAVVCFMTNHDMDPEIIQSVVVQSVCELECHLALDTPLSSGPWFCENCDRLAERLELIDTLVCFMRKYSVPEVEVHEFLIRCLHSLDILYIKPPAAFSLQHHYATTTTTATTSSQKQHQAPPEPVSQKARCREEAPTAVVI